MPRCVLVLVSFAALETSAEPLTHRRPATATSEATRLGAEYFVQRSGTTWTYQGRSGAKGKVTINQFVEWRALITYSFGNRTSGGSWRIRDGEWLEKLSGRSDAESVVLPAVMTRGSHWRAPASFERGTKEIVQYEVVALDAELDLPNGKTVNGCLVVLETGIDGSLPYTHYYLPNMGKVGVRGPDDWVYKLAEYSPGSRRRQE